ncbi:tubulin delta chain-like isoform X2 [Anthonomus grandis grandis]|uniref:tubulin delta chain-like isoform X2 n=1 Tax=Anthonomus grandis grandis TaxID=2921223 RepID=UPI0021662DBD|nr:tubulin delta chain-like isoform X2 [Anthonomus grandis grandis]XP_050314014.1 tubulin delta chain-like isoform X2 [Anthonomus grandis grandis]XP_050314015.1 tubulin delta chain-like isoform X2 [Anthonomus grandis grandis]
MVNVEIKLDMIFILFYLRIFNKEKKITPTLVTNTLINGLIWTTKECLGQEMNLNRVVAESIGGCANNWAAGYMENNKTFIQEVLDIVRSENEKSDSVLSLLNIYSLSGGTGSGVGSSIIENLCDLYSKKNIINCAVLPYVRGEISTQSYNCVLNLSKLYSITTSTIIFENEKLLHLCKYSLGLSNINYYDINRIISQQIASFFHPVKNVNDSLNLINNLVVHPYYKFLQIRTEPNVKITFENSLENAMIKQSCYDLKHSNKVNKCLSSVFICRGKEISISKILKNSHNFVSWIPEQHKNSIYYVNSPFLKYKSFLTQCFNANNIVTPLQTLINDAWISFTHGAYLHHYNSFGVDKEYFLNSFQQMENILYDYINI